MAKKDNQTFQHRHYELIAKILGAVKSAKLTYKIKGDLRADGYNHAVNHFENVLITCFENDNVNFSCDRFLNAVGGAEELARLSPLTLKDEIY